MGPSEGFVNGPAASGPSLGDRVVVPAAFAVPGPPHVHVRRARLEEMLDDGVRGPLTLVTAPAGTGKTVLVSCWASRLTATNTVVWLSLDDHGVSLTRFWQLLSAGLARAGVGAPRAADRRRSTDTPLSSPEATSDAVLASSVPVVLVIDCDAVLSSDLASALEWLLTRSDGQLRTVLLTREDPLLPLYRYRLEERVVEVRMADLAFTSQEARELLTGMGVDLSSTAMDALVERTQGWVAGLRMAAMSLAHRADREAAARHFAGDSGTVAEYLLAEVLDTAPEGLRQLMLDTSVVDVVRPGLAVALAGPHAERALAFLAHGNAFLEELPDASGCYRYHHLFRELLRAQLAFESPARSAELHRVAAAWLADNDLAEEAVRHAVHVSDWESAARYAVDDLAIVPLLTGQPTEPLHDALSKIPTAGGGGAVSVVSAARALAAGDLEGGAAGISRAHEAISGPAASSWPAGELSLALVELARARQTGDVETAFRTATAAQELVGVQDPARVAAHPEISAVISEGLGAALVHAGRPRAAAELFTAPAVKDETSGRAGPLVDSLAQGALLAALGGELQRATELATRALKVSSDAGPVPAGEAGAAEVALAYVGVERYDLAAARRHATRSGTPNPRDPLSTTVLALARARLGRAAGDLHAALEVVTSTRRAGALPAWLGDLLLEEEAELLDAQQQPQRARQARQRLSQERLQQSRVEGLVASASRHAADGNERSAERDLDHALRLAAPELSRRALREAPAQVWRILRQHDELLGRHAWLTDRHAADAAGVVTQRSAPPAPARLYHRLTDKEQEVLGHLSELLTTEEIAAVMYISVNTVRTHVRNILRKLGASRRNEAVRRARELHLLAG